jgi:hypothetical protein
LNIYNPNSDLDYRISVNIEHLLPQPDLSTNPTLSRYKDRISYTLYPLQVDLTMVRMGDVKQFELEVEISEEHITFEVCDALVSTIQTLSRQ